MSFVRIVATESGTSISVNGVNVDAEAWGLAQTHPRSALTRPGGMLSLHVLSSERPHGDGWTPMKFGKWWELRPTRVEISAVTEPQTSPRDDANDDKEAP